MICVGWCQTFVGIMPWVIVILGIVAVVTVVRSFRD